MIGWVKKVLATLKIPCCGSPQGLLFPCHCMCLSPGLIGEPYFPISFQVSFQVNLIHGCYPLLPRVVVDGAQSSGKGLVLERLTKVTVARVTQIIFRCGLRSIEWKVNHSNQRYPWMCMTVRFDVVRKDTVPGWNECCRSHKLILIKDFVSPIVHGDFKLNHLLEDRWNLHRYVLQWQVFNKALN